MDTVQITNGTIKHGKTLKLGDFENKRGDIELSFNIAEGADTDAALNHVKKTIHRHLASVLETTQVEKEPVAAPAAPEPETKKPAKKAAKLPKEEKAADAAEIDDSYDRAPLPKKPADAADIEDPVPPLLKKEIAAQNAKAAEESDDLDDLLGTGEEAKEITDKELLDATNKKQAEVKNGPAIRKILAEFGIKSPPGRIIDLQQKDRQAYLEKLKDIKPLA